ncbi:PqqD family protein [Microbacterium sp. NPDC089321]|uniref:PqqD family protein n=1 Tax=Microbacterium sp. NPDC089321 TaxID=3155183 RepID=UPI0034468DCC
MTAVLRPHPLCGVFDAGAELYVARLPDGPIIALDEVSALIWRSAGTGSRADVIATVAEATGEKPDAIAQYIHAFLDDLVARGLLVASAAAEDVP